MRFRSNRSAVFYLVNKFINLDYEIDWDGTYVSHGRKACIPLIIFSDGHAEWTRWYWFKDKYEHIMRGHYVGFK